VKSFGTLKNVFKSEVGQKKNTHFIIRRFKTNYLLDSLCYFHRCLISGLTMHACRDTVKRINLIDRSLLRK